MTHPRPATTIGACILLLAVARGSIAAAPKLETLFPPGVQRGQSVELTATGKFDHWPPQAWVDRPGLAVEPLKDKGRLKIAAAPDAAPGVYYLRLHDADGATTLRPFIVGTLPELADAEPNDDPRKPQPLDASATINGRLEKTGDVDTFAIQLDGGQTLVASLVAHRTLDSPMDAVMQLCTPDGAVIAQSDDHRGRDPQITFTAPHSGSFLVRIFAFPLVPTSAIQFAGAPNFIYRLTITTGPFIDAAAPLCVHASQPTKLTLRGPGVDGRALNIHPPASNLATLAAPDIANTLELPAFDLTPRLTDAACSPDKPQPAAVGQAFTGTIARPGDVHAFTLSLTKAVPVALRARAYSIDSPLDPALRVTDASGKQLADADDINANTNRDAELTFTPPADGTYTLHLRDLAGAGGPRHFYLLTIQSGSDFTLTAPELTTAARGKTAEITVQVTRHNKFAEPIEITAVDLPPGVTAAPVTADSKAKEVKLKLTLAPDAAPGPFHIRGVAGPLARLATYPVPARPRAHTSLWLTPTGEPK